MEFDQIGKLTSGPLPLQAESSTRHIFTPTHQLIDANLEIRPQTPASSAHQPSSQELHDAINKIKEAMPPSVQNLQFSMDNETGQTVIKIIDGQTQTVLRQIPNQELIDIAQALNKFQGIFLTNKA